MLCRKPFMAGVLPYGCGQCLPCRINRRRVWTHRLLLEQTQHGDACFVTLTYDPDHLPKDNGLVPAHITLWLKRLRKALGSKKIRYFVCGEYGQKGDRPHYHAALFGIGIEFKKLIHSSWGMGHVLVGDLNKNSAQYICGYVTKKMTSCDDEKLQGRHPEFSRMSRRPGIGAHAMQAVGNALTTEYGADIIIQNKDVPSNLQHGKKSMPLGRYLKSVLRKEVGIDEEKAKQENVKRYSLEMFDVLEVIYGDEKSSRKSLKQVIVKNSEQKALNQRARFKIFADKKGAL